MAEMDSYNYWLDQLASRSQSTRDAYKIYFNQFLDYAKTTPNKLIEMQRKAREGGGDPRENHVVESKVRAWLAETKETKSVSTRRMMLASLKSFFALNFHPLRLNRLDRPQGESVGSRIPEREEVICIADAGKWKYRTAVMFLKDSGLRISDVVRVKWEDKVDMGDGFWNFNLVTKKRQLAVRRDYTTLKTDYATLKTNYEALTSDLETSALETARKKLLSEIASQALEDAKNELMEHPCAKYEELVTIMRKIVEKEETEKTEE